MSVCACMCVCVCEYMCVCTCACVCVCTCVCTRVSHTLVYRPMAHNQILQCLEEGCSTPMLGDWVFIAAKVLQKSPLLVSALFILLLPSTNYNRGPLYKITVIKKQHALGSDATHSALSRHVVSTEPSRALRVALSRVAFRDKISIVVRSG